MEKSTMVKHLRMSPKKVGFVVRGFRNLPAEEAIQVGKLSVGKAEKLISAAIKSTLQLFEKADWAKVKVKNLIVGRGPAFKRGRAGGRGMQHLYLKRTSHLKVILDLPNK